MAVTVRNRGNEAVAEIERIGGTFGVRLLDPERTDARRTLCVTGESLGDALWAVCALVAQWGGLDYMEVQEVVQRLL